MEINSNFYNAGMNSCAHSEIQIPILMWLDPTQHRFFINMFLLAYVKFRAVHPFEADVSGKMIPERMIKDYAQSAADQVI
jgi:hypothetical protein